MFHFFFIADKATNPRNREDDWEFIMDFCDRVLAELEGYCMSKYIFVFSTLLKVSWVVFFSLWRILLLSTKITNADRNLIMFS